MKGEYSTSDYRHKVLGRHMSRERKSLRDSWERTAIGYLYESNFCEPYLIGIKTVIVLGSISTIFIGSSGRSAGQSCHVNTILVGRPYVGYS